METPTNPVTVFETMFGIAELVSKHGTCPRKKVGCVITDSSYAITAVGFNTTPWPFMTCDQMTKGCIIEGGHCSSSVHAEIAAIADAARRGIRLEGSMAFCTLLPCLNCFHALVMAGVFRIYYDQEYDREEKQILLARAKNGEYGLIKRSDIQ